MGFNHLHHLWDHRDFPHILRQVRRMSRVMSVHVSVMPETETEAVKVMEVFSRAATGLAFEGISTSINISNYEEEDSDGGS